jgi:hypothetical protein
MLAEFVPLDVGRELGLLVGGLITAAFTLARLSISQQRNLVDRLMKHYDQTIDRQEKSAFAVGKSLDVLTESVQENTRVIRQSMESKVFRQ